MLHQGGSRLVNWLYVSVVVVLAAACGGVSAPSGPTSTAASFAPTGPRTGGVVSGARPPAPDHIVIVVFENKDVDDVLQSGQAPYLDQLASSGVNFGNAYAETHPSQPNYLALFSGSTQGVTDNSCLGPLDAPNLATQLLAAGRSFVGYSEGLPGAGFTGCRSGGFVQKHAPWSAFTNVPPSAHQPWSAWPDRYEQLPTVAVVIPDLCNDMHDCDVATGDRWLRDHLSDYLGWARTHNSLLIVTFDESQPTNATNRIVTLIDGAGIRPGPSDQRIDHYTLLRTIEDMYALPALGRAADTTAIVDIWR